MNLKKDIPKLQKLNADHYEKLQHPEVRKAYAYMETEAEYRRKQEIKNDRAAAIILVCLFIGLVVFLGVICKY